LSHRLAQSIRGYFAGREGITPRRRKYFEGRERTTMINASEIAKNKHYAERALSAGKGGYSYQATLAASQKVNWPIEDIIGGDNRLDFTKPFMPESLARVEPLNFLSADEKLILNQIRGNAYLSIFGLVEEFILPFVLDHARPHLHGEDYRLRAL